MITWVLGLAMSPCMYAYAAKMRYVQFFFTCDLFEALRLPKSFGRGFPQSAWLQTNASAARFMRRKGS